MSHSHSHISESCCVSEQVPVLSQIGNDISENIGPGAMGLRHNIAHHASPNGIAKNHDAKTYNERHWVLEKSVPLSFVFKLCLEF